MNYSFVYQIKSYLTKLIWLALAIFFIINAFLFSDYKTHLFASKFFNPYYEFLSSSPIWINMLIASIFLSIFSVILFFILSLYFNIQRSRMTKLRAKHYKHFAYILSNYFFSNFYDNELAKKNLLLKITPHLKSRIQYISFLESFLKIQETVALDLSETFKHLIRELNIQSKLESLIYSANFDDKVLAMRMLSYLSNNKHDKLIKKYAESNNFALRTEAYAALILLMKKDESLIQFIGEKHNLSILDINIIVNAVIKNHKMDINYQALLSSEKNRKIMIGLLLAKYRYRKNTKNLILILNHIGNKNQEFNKLAWDALLTLIPEADALEIITNRFEKESEDVKKIILKKSHNFHNERFFSFLKNIINHQSLMIKIEILKIFFEKDFDSLTLFQDSKNKEITLAYNEIACMYN